MALFFDSTSFEKGGWAPELNRKIAPLRFIPDWRPRLRLWQATWNQWVQFEPDGWSGPFFWSGKPAIRFPLPDSHNGISAPADEALSVGYYAERGLPTHQLPERIMDHRWHWHGLEQCLTDTDLRDELNDLMLNLPAERRMIWICGSRTSEPDGQILPEFAHILPYVGQSTLTQTKVIIDGIKSNRWINLILGSRFTKAECLARQGDLVAEFRNPIVRANEIRQLVENAIPKSVP